MGGSEFKMHRLKAIMHFHASYHSVFMRYEDDRFEINSFHNEAQSLGLEIKWKMKQ